MSDARLQELYAQALARRSDATAAACVTPEQLLQLARREGAEADRLTLLDHVMGCPACQRELDLLRAVESVGRRITRDRPVRSIGRRVPLALAASLLLMVGVGLLARNRFAGDTMRGGGGQLTLLSPPTEVPPGRPITFAWRPLPGMSRYHIEVLDQNGKAIFSETTRDTTVTWSAGELRAGMTYQWWVRDLTPGSRLISPVRPIRVRSR